MEALPGNIFATSSRDCTVRIWKLVDNAEWGLLNLLNCHEQLADKAGIAVSHYIPAGTPGYPESAIVSGGYDSKAVVSHPETSQIYHTLSGHKEAVVSITHTHGGDIVTGSLDKYDQFGLVSLLFLFPGWLFIAQISELKYLS